MQTSRFQLGLMATLAVGLGFSLASSDAVGYPSGAAVSMGSNPGWSVGGQIGSGGSTMLVTAAPDQAAVVTDLLVQPETSSTDGVARFSLELDDGTSMGHYRSWTSASMGGSFEHTFDSGIKVPQGRSLYIKLYHAGYTVNYIASGYYAQP